MGVRSFCTFLNDVPVAVLRNLVTRGNDYFVCAHSGVRGVVLIEAAAFYDYLCVGAVLAVKGVGGGNRFECTAVNFDLGIAGRVAVLIRRYA